MEEDVVDMSITLEEDDHVAFLQFYLQQHPSGRRIRPNAWIFAIAAILLYIAIQWRDPERDAEAFGPFLLGMAITAAILLGAFVLLIRYAPEWIMRTAVRIGPRKHTLQPTAFHFDRSGIEITNHQGRGHLDWKYVESVGESGAHIFILLGGLHAFIIPKRLFETPQDAGQFSAYLRAHAATPRAAA